MKTACEIMIQQSEHDKLVEGISRGIATDFVKLIEEQIILLNLNYLPMDSIPQEAQEQFDRLTKFGCKLNLISNSAFV